MKRFLAVLALFMGSAAGAAQPLKYLVGLPISAGVVASDGPWLLAIWPDMGCKDCEFNDDDVTAYKAARDGLLSSDVDFPSSTETHFFILNSSAKPAKKANLASIRDAIKFCKFGAEGILRRPERAGPGRSFAVQVDCPGKATSSFVSLNFKAQKLESVYWLPEGSIPVILNDG